MSLILVFSDDIKGNFWTITDPDGTHTIRISATVDPKIHIETLFPKYTNSRLAFGGEMVDWLDFHPDIKIIGNLEVTEEGVTRH
jgi:hypothetical protein